MKTVWRDCTDQFLSEKIGPASGVVIDLALNKMASDKQKMSSSRDYLEFIKQLQIILPKDINANTLCENLWIEVLNNNVFI
jgi:hypothetical protein